jgi:hypothetical protein
LGDPSLSKTNEAVMKIIALAFSALSLMALSAIPANAEQYKMQTPIPPSITTPDTVQTRIGTLKFFDGFPDKATIEKVYDNLDFQHGVQAYLTALPAVSIEGFEKATLRSVPSTRPSSSPSSCWTANRCS